MVMTVQFPKEHLFRLCKSCQTSIHFLFSIFFCVLSPQINISRMTLDNILVTAEVSLKPSADSNKLTIVVKGQQPYYGNYLNKMLNDILATC